MNTALSYQQTRRKLLAAGLLPVLGIAACQSKKVAVAPRSFQLVVFNYLDSPVDQIFLGENLVGLAEPFPHTDPKAVVEVQVQPGLLPVHWRFVKTGVVVYGRNIPELGDVASNMQYLGLHIFVDLSVQLVASASFPTASPSASKQSLLRSTDAHDAG